MRGMIAANLGRTALGALLGVLACLRVAAAEPAIQVVDAWARATPPGVDNGAVYCTIVNHGDKDKLVGARTPVASGAEIHASVSTNGVVGMRRIEALPIAARASEELAPGSTHLMLVGLGAPLSPGVKIPLTLVFAAAGEIAVEVPVVDARSPAAHQREHAHEHPAQ
jgi:periplasmic copper chaperone A